MVSYAEAYLKAKNDLAAVGIKDAALEARFLLQHVCGNKIKDTLTAEEEALFVQLVHKRGTRYPLQYIFGEWDFLDFTLAVGDGVLIPRQDTECVCLAAIEKAKLFSRPTVVDLCGGSGAIALGVQRHVPQAEVTCVELSDDALLYLRKNAAGCVRVVQADVFSWQNSCAPGSIDILTANPPYISAAEMPSLAPELSYEPEMALLAAEDGLAFYKHIAKEYMVCVKENGWIVLEIGYRQAEAVQEILHTNGWQNIEIRKDLNGQDRVAIAQKL